MRCLIIDATSHDSIPAPESRDGLVIELILRDLHTLPEYPLGLPFPSDPRLQKLCRDFVKKPSSRATIDEWADRMAMSRRSFTRHFQRETGVSLFCMASTGLPVCRRTTIVRRRAGDERGAGSRI